MNAVRVSRHVKRIPAPNAEIRDIEFLMQQNMPSPLPVDPEISEDLWHESKLADDRNEERDVVLEGPDTELTVRFHPGGTYSIDAQRTHTRRRRHSRRGQTFK